MYTLLHATHYVAISIFFYEVSGEKNPIVDERHRHFQAHELTTTTAPQASACTNSGWMVQVVAPRQSAGVGDVSVEASRCGKVRARQGHLTGRITKPCCSSCLLVSTLWHRYKPAVTLLSFNPKHVCCARRVGDQTQGRARPRVCARAGGTTPHCAEHNLAALRGARCVERCLGIVLLRYSFFPH